MTLSWQRTAITKQEGGVVTPFYQAERQNDKGSGKAPCSRLCKNKKSIERRRVTPGCLEMCADAHVYARWPARLGENWHRDVFVWIPSKCAQSCGGPLQWHHLKKAEVTNQAGGEFVGFGSQHLFEIIKCKQDRAFCLNSICLWSDAWMHLTPSSEFS